MSQKFLCAANWKMNKGPKETKGFFSQFIPQLSKEKQKNVAFFVSGYNLPATQEALKGTDIIWGAQNCYSQLSGAFTGENSAQVLKEMGSQQCLVGHSERRQLFGETDEWISEKVQILQSLDMIPMICVGETLEQRESEKTKEVVLSQVKQALSKADLGKEFIIAYEPVWAIGTGKVATPEMAEETHSVIRDLLKEMMGAESGERVYILYGGSVKPENSKELFMMPNIDGFLVGGASLKVDSFLSLTEVI